MQDNTAKWGVRKLTKFKENSGIPVGFEYFSTNPNVPMGSLPLLGGEYSRKVYSDLWAWVQEQAGYLIEESEWQEKSRRNEGNVPFYSKGNGTTTFRVPSLKCWVKGANGIEEVGSYLSAGLPNITGSAYVRQYVAVGNNFNGGALSGSAGNDDTNAPYACAFNNTLRGQGYINLDASQSNPIYGNSDTVQPKSIVGMWLVKAYGTVTNVGNIDVADIVPTKVSDLENDAGYLTQHQSLEYEKYASYVISGASSQPASSVMQYTATGAFTLNLSSISSKLAAEEATVFTAYIKSDADYTLTITNAGTIKYIGSASDVAITSAGLLLNIMMLKDASGNVTSIVQASKLS